MFWCIDAEIESKPIWELLLGTTKFLFIFHFQFCVQISLIRSFESLYFSCGAYGFSMCVST